VRRWSAIPLPEKNGKLPYECARLSLFRIVAGDLLDESLLPIIHMALTG
jgi:hypothetical protein